MKITSVSTDPRKRAFEVRTAKGVFELPYAKVDPEPSEADWVAVVHLDEELGREGFTYRMPMPLRSSPFWAPTVSL